MRKRSSITTQLMLRIIPLVAMLMAVVVGAVMLLTNVSVQEMAKSELKKDAYGNKMVLTKYISDALSSLEPVKDVLETVDFKDDKECLAYMETTMVLNENIPNGVYVGDDRGNYLDSSLWEPGPDYVVTERDWYMEGTNHENFALGVPYVDADTGKMIVSISSAVNKKGWGKAVLVGDMFLDRISTFISELTVMDAGYSFVFDPDNDMMIAHKNTKYNGKTLNEAGKAEGILGPLEEERKAGGLENQVLTIKADGNTYMAVAEPIENSTWYLVSCVPENIVLEKLYDLLYKISLIAVGLTIVVLFVIAVSLRKRTKPIKRLTDVIENITSGDFTENLIPAGNNEITTMTEKLKEFIEGMGGTIRKLSEISSHLGEQSGTSSDISKVLSESAAVQSKSMGQLNVTVDDLAHSIESIAENATSLAEAVNVVFHNSAEAEEKVTETVVAAKKGKNDIEKVASTMDEINGTMDNLSQIVREVGDSTAEINSITELIGDITGQTNLLALNASIEAARAGEAGKGFAVVADEIGKLANMCSKAVKQISDLIDKINRQVADTIEQTKQSVDNIKESKELVDASYGTFIEIYDKVLITDHNIKNVSSKIREVEDVAGSMAAITEEQSASTEEILAASENLCEQSQNIAENSHEMEEMAKRLETTASVIRNRMSEFKA